MTHAGSASPPEEPYRPHADTTAIARVGWISRRPILPSANGPETTFEIVARLHAARQRRRRRQAADRADDAPSWELRGVGAGRGQSFDQGGGGGARRGPVRPAGARRCESSIVDRLSMDLRGRLG